MVELLIILALGVEHFPIFYRTEVFRLVVPKNLNCLHMRERFFWVCCGLQDVNHTKFSMRQSLTKFKLLVLWFSNALSVLQGYRVGEYGVFDPLVIGQLKF